MDLVAGLGHTLDTSFTCIHLSRAEIHTPLTSNLWFINWVRLLESLYYICIVVLASCGTSWVHGLVELLLLLVIAVT
jgi:hypothetical protein